MDNNNNSSNFPSAPGKTIWQSGWIDELWSQLTTGTYSGIGNVVLDDGIAQTETQVLADLDAVDRILLGASEIEDLLSDVQRYANDHSFNPGIDPVTGTPEIAHAAESLVQVMQYVQQQGLPDLTAEVGELTLDEVALPGDGGRLSLTLANQGGLEIQSPVRLKIFASEQNNLDAAPVEIGEIGFGKLKIEPGETKTASAVVELPDNLPAGEYHISVVVDAEGSVPEADELNNIVVAGFTQTVAWQFGNIGGESRQLALYEADGDVVRYRLKGDGYGEITESNGLKQIVLHGTSDKTEVNIQADGDGHTLGGVTINGDLKQFYGTKTDLQGNLTLSGSLDRLVLDDVDDAQIVIGPGKDDEHQVDIKLDQVSNLTLTSQSALETLEAKNWTRETGATSQVIAPGLNNLKMKGDFIADVAIAGELKKAKVDGVSAGIWQIGQTEKLDLFETGADWSLSVAGELGKLDVKRNLLGTVAAGDLNRVLVKGDAVNAHILVGAGLGADGVLGSDDAYGSGELKEFIVQGNVVASIIGAGLAPLDSSFVNGNEQLVPGGVIGKIDVKGAVSDDSLFAAESFIKSIKLNEQKVDPESDDRFLTPSKVVADADAPVVTLSLVEDTGSDNADGITRTVEIAGTVSDESDISSIKAGFGDTPIAEYVEVTQYLQDGQFTLDKSALESILGEPLSEGTYTLKVIATDTLGITSEPLSYDFTHDTTGPSLSLISPAVDSEHSSYVHLVGSVDEAVSVTTTLSGAEDVSFTVDAPGDFDQLLQSLPLSAGIHQLALTLTDVAGNVAQQVVDFEVSESRFVVGPSGGTGWAIATENSLILGESDSYVVEATLPVALGQSEGSRTLRFAVDAAFDTTDAGATEDRFALYLVDPANPQQTLLDNGVSGTPIFALEGESAEFTPGLVRYDGQYVEIDLTELSDFTEGRLVFQFLNQDGDTGSRVRVSDITSEVDLEGEQGPRFSVDTTLAPLDGELAIEGLTVSESVKALFSNARFDIETGEYTAELRVHNTGSESIGRQAAVIFGALPDGVSLVSASGTDTSGNAYVSLQEAIRPGGLQPGQISEGVAVTFSNPSQVRMELVPEVLVGEPNRAPVFPEIEQPLTVMPGEKLEISLEAIDPDGDSVTYSIRSERDLPKGRLDGSGKLVFEPSPEQIGTYSFTLVATDGAVETVQSVTLEVVADPDTTTRISGQVLDTEGHPLANTPIELGAAQTTTDADGYFTITPVDNADALKIFGDQYVSSIGEEFPFVAEKLPLVLGHELYAGVNNVIDRPIYLPALDLVNNAQTTDGNGDITVTNAALEAKVFVAANSLLDPDGNPFTGSLSISEVPREFTPAALPTELSPDLVVTIQPGDMVFTEPALLTLPNRAGWAPGTAMNLWSINPTTGDFDIVGKGEVSEDGSLIETVEGGIRNSSWHMLVPEAAQPKPTDRNINDECEECLEMHNFTSTVESHSGVVVETHELVSYQSQGERRGIRLTYDSLRAAPSPIVHTAFEAIETLGNTYLISKLTLKQGDFEYRVPGYEGDAYGLSGGEHFWRVPNGNAQYSVAMQADLKNLASGAYQYEVESGFYLLNEGVFAGSAVTTGDRLIHVNSVDSALGSGWGIAGVQELVENSDGSILLIDGDGSDVLFESSETRPNEYNSPASDFSTLAKLSDGTFLRTTEDQTVYRFNSSNKLVSITDRNQNVTQHIYSDELLTSIVDPVGLVTSFTYQNDRISSITDPAGRVTELKYSDTGDLVEIIDPDKTKRVFEYDGSHLMTAEIDKQGYREQAFYDFAGRASHAIKKDGSVVKINPVQVQGLYNPELTARKSTAPFISANESDSISHYADANGDVTRTFLDDSGRRITSIDREGSTATLQRDENYLVQSTFSTKGEKTSYKYDESGNVIEITYPSLSDKDSPLIRQPTFSDWVKVTDYDYDYYNEFPKITDLNGDGRSDIGLGSKGFFLSLEDDGFSEAYDPFSADIYTDLSSEYYLDDFNGDGILDLLNYGFLHYGIDGESFSEPKPVEDDGYYVEYPIASGDIDNDGDIDVVEYGGGYANAYLGVYLNDGEGEFSLRTEYDFTEGSWVSPHGPAIVSDFDNDGNLDISVYSYNNLSVLFGEGDGSFVLSTINNNDYDAERAFVADVDENGFVDIILDSWYDSLGNPEGEIFLNDGDGTFTTYKASLNSLIPDFQVTGVSDLDGDGDADLMGVTHNSSSQSSPAVYLKNNQGTYDKPTNISRLLESVDGYINRLISADFNGDGQEDLLLATYDEIFVSYNTGVALFTDDSVGSSTEVVRSYTYDPTFNQLTSVTDELQRRTLYEIDEFGNRISERRVVGEVDSEVNGEADDVVMTYSYTDTGLVDTQTDALGRVTDYDYNAQGLLASIIFAKGTADEATQSFEYDAAGNQTAVIDENGNRTEYVYDEMNRQVQVIAADPDGADGALISPTTYTTYDEGGSVIAQTDANGNVSTNEYDEVGRLIKTTDALGNVSRNEYDARGNLVATINALGRKTEYLYDTRGRLEKTIRADGSVVKTSYDADNNRTQSVDANGNGSRTIYDERNRVSQTIDALGNITRFEYDAAGQMTAQIDASGNRTEYDYDELGRRVAVTDALGNVTRTEYDKAGRVTAQIDGLGKETRFEYDDRDRQIATIDPLGSITTTTYDDLGNILSITDAVNNTTSYIYDDLNRLIEETNQLGATRFYRYDAQSNRVAAIDRNGRERAFVYDALNRQVEEQWLDELGTVTRRTRSVYDAAGQMIEVSDPDSTYRYSYDALGRQVTVDNAGTPNVPNVVLTYAYDDVGNLVSVSDTIDGQAGGINTYGYDKLNRMTQLTQSGNGVSEKRVDFTYSPIGQFETISRYSDLAGTSPVVTTTYDYDENNRLERLSHSNSSAEVAFYDFTYDAAHRISGITDIDGTTDYSYNDRDELTGADHSDVDNPDESYSYDANGNRVSSSLHGSDYVTGSNNQLTADGVYTYEYDAEGNLTKQTETATGDVRVFEWDYRNRLVAVIDSDVAGSEVQQVAYTYDAMGRRIAKAVDADGAGSAAAETLRFVYDRDDVLLEFEGESVAPSQRYLHGPQVDQVLTQEDTAGETLWHLSDHLGTVKDLANDVGEVVNHRTYNSYGTLIMQGDDSFDSRYGYTGREFDEETGLHYYRARYYSGSAGRFINQDPIGYAGKDSNLYRYAYNFPNGATDPSGLETIIYYHESFPGHVSIDVDGVVYTFGRYRPQNNTQSFGASGDGILYKVPRERYLNHENGFRSEDVTVRRWSLNYSDLEEGLIKNFFDNLYDNGTAHNSITLDDGSNTVGVDIGRYNLFQNNCTTITIDSLPPGLVKDRLSRRNPFRNEFAANAPSAIAQDLEGLILFPEAVTPLSPIEP